MDEGSEGYDEAQNNELDGDGGGDDGDGDGGSILIKALAFLFCIGILAAGFYMSFSYQEKKRKVEVDRINSMRDARLKGEADKADEEELKRIKITEALKGCGISMSDMGNNNNSESSENDTDRTIPNGNEEKKDEDRDSSTKKTTPLDAPLAFARRRPSQGFDSAVFSVGDRRPSYRENVTETLDAEDVDEEQFLDIEDIEEPSSTMEVMNNNKTTNTNTNFFGEKQDEITRIPMNDDYDFDDDDDDEDDDIEENLKMNSTTTETNPPVKIPASKLVQAVYDNPCAICLEAFQIESDDTIIFCSNTKTPHPFHQECSLDYLVSHAEGVQAPCPLCRQPFMYTQEHEEEARGGDTNAVSSCPSSLSLKDLLEAREEGIHTGASHPSSLSLKDLLAATEVGITFEVGNAISHPSSLSLTDLLAEAAKQSQK